MDHGEGTAHISEQKSLCPINIEINCKTERNENCVNNYEN